MDNLEILHSDDYLVAINKPGGLLVHRTDLDPFETQFAVQILRDQLNKHVFPIHRLDKPTSGVLLFALQKETAQLISELLLNKQIHKEYIAIVRGWMPDNVKVDRGVRVEKDRPRREALTNFSKISQVEVPYPVGPFATARYSLIRALPETGRRHQIRKHLNHISYPILGDSWYGDRDHNNFAKEEFGMADLFLHALRVKFIHPILKEQMIINAPVPLQWREMLDHLGFDNEIIDKL